MYSLMPLSLRYPARPCFWYSGSFSLFQDWYCSQDRPACWDSHYPHTHTHAVEVKLAHYVLHTVYNNKECSVDICTWWQWCCFCTNTFTWHSFGTPVTDISNILFNSLGVDVIINQLKHLYRNAWLYISKLTFNDWRREWMEFRREIKQKVGNRKRERSRHHRERQNTYRLFTLSTETVAALKTGNLQLVSIIDKAIWTLRRRWEERYYDLIEVIGSLKIKYHKHTGLLPANSLWMETSPPVAAEKMVARPHRYCIHGALGS